MAEKIVSATASTADIPYETIITARGHSLIADEEEKDGGRDKGPRPGELMCMSLASCTAITLSMYAGRKGWNTGRITVKVTRIMHESDTDFIVELHTEHKLDDTSRERLLLIAKKCPVHKVLTNPIRIEAKFSDPNRV
jgi:putative redox protein